MRISSAGGGLLLLRREKDLAGLCGPGPSLLGFGLSRPGNKQSCYQQAEDEPADVGEERDGAAVRLGVEQPEVRLDELVQEPEPEEDPGRDPDQERSGPRAGTPSDSGSISRPLSGLLPPDRPGRRVQPGSG